MKTLTTIQDFLKTNPSKEEVAKVMKVINRMVSSQVRTEIWQNEKQLRKLVSVEKKLKEIEINIPGDIQAGIKDLKTKIEDLRKGLPEVKKRVLKEVKK